MVITKVPWLVQALRRVDIHEGAMERHVVDAGEAVLQEVVSGRHDEVDLRLLRNLPHLTPHKQTFSDRYTVVLFSFLLLIGANKLTFSD